MYENSRAECTFEIHLRAFEEKHVALFLYTFSVMKTDTAQCQLKPTINLRYGFVIIYT